MLTAKWLTAEPQPEGAFLRAEDSSHPPSIYPTALLIKPNVAVYASHSTTNLEEACKCKLAPTDPSLFERTCKHVVLDLALSQQQFSSAPPFGLAPTRFGRHAARGEFPSEERKQTRVQGRTETEGRGETGGQKDGGWRPISSQHPNLDVFCSLAGPKTATL